MAAAISSCTEDPSSLLDPLWWSQGRSWPLGNRGCCGRRGRQTTDPSIPRQAVPAAVPACLEGVEDEDGRRGRNAGRRGAALQLGHPSPSWHPGQVGEAQCGGHRLPHHQADPVPGAEIFPVSLVPGRGAAVGPGKAAGSPPAPCPCTEHGEGRRAGWLDAGMEPDPESSRSNPFQMPRGCVVAQHPVSLPGGKRGHLCSSPAPLLLYHPSPLGLPPSCTCLTQPRAL